MAEDWLGKQQRTGGGVNPIGGGGAKPKPEKRPYSPGKQEPAPEVPPIRDSAHLKELLQNAEGDSHLLAIIKQMRSQGLFVSRELAEFEAKFATELPAEVLRALGATMP